MEDVYRAECFMESISLLSGALLGIRAIIRRPACTMSPRERQKERMGEDGVKRKEQDTMMERAERK